MFEQDCARVERQKQSTRETHSPNKACRSITGCLIPTSVENVYLLAGTAAPPGVRRATTYRQEKRQHTEDPRHSLYSHEPVNKRAFCHAT